MFHALQRQYRDVRTFGARSLLRFLPSARTTREHVLTVRSGPKFFVREGTTDLEVIRQVFQSGEYDLTRFRRHYAQVIERYDRLVANGNTPVIIDAGANIGAASLFFARAFPRARILAVEPEPANAFCSRRNCAANERITVHEAAIGSAGGAIVLDNPSGHAWAPRSLRAESGQGIDIVTIPQLVESVPNGALLIAKIDIEGFESDLFAENLDWIDETEVILVEIHDWMMPGKRTSASLQRAMGVRDFELVISGENLIYFNQRGGIPV